MGLNNSLGGSLSGRAPTVSVVTPSLNRRRQLEGLIESLQAQNYSNIEHIVVDGGSSDGTQDLLQRQPSTPRFRWLSEPDEGVYSAVNKGLRLATGEIVAYLNTDDRYFDYSISTVVREFLEHPEVVFVYGDLLRFHLLERVGELNFYPPFSSAYVQRGPLISQPTVFFRRDLLLEIGYFDESFRLAADIDYWVRCARVGRGRKIDEVLAFETFHQGRLTAGSSAVDLAHEELARIRSRGSESWARPLLAAKDRIRASLWDRIARVRFLVANQLPESSHWRGFRQTTFRVHGTSLAMSLLPFLRRKHRFCVESDPSLPWEDLEELVSSAGGD